MTMYNSDFNLYDDSADEYIFRLGEEIQGAENYETEYAYAYHMPRFDNLTLDRFRMQKQSTSQHSNNGRTIVRPHLHILKFLNKVTR